MSVDLTVVAEGLGFPEGPVAMTDGSLLFVDVKDQTLSRLTADGRVDVVARVPGGPNGAAIGPDGAIYICNNGGVYTFIIYDGATVPGPPPPSYQGGSIQRVDPASGEVTTLYDSCGGARLLAPNDIVFDQSGGFWFTTSGFQDEAQIQKGALYYASIDGKRIVKAATIPTANGVGLSPHGTTVYVSDSIFGRLWALDLLDPEAGSGQVKPGPLPVMPGRVVQTLPGFQWLDSLKVEASGRICVGTIFNGGITVFSPEGATDHVAVPDLFTTNMCFGGEDMRDLWITASSTGKIYKTRWPRPGLKLAFNT